MQVVSKWELLQIVEAFIIALLALQRVAAQQAEAKAAEFAKATQRFVERAACQAAQQGDTAALQAFLDSRGAEFVAMIPNTWGEFDPIRMFHHAVMGGAVDTMQMLLAAYPEAGLEKRVRLMETLKRPLTRFIVLDSIATSWMMSGSTRHKNAWTSSSLLFPASLG